MEEMAEAMREIVHRINRRTLLKRDNFQGVPLLPLPSYNVSVEFTNPNPHPSFCEMSCDPLRCGDLVREAYPLDVTYLPYGPPLCVK